MLLYILVSLLILSIFIWKFKKEKYADESKFQKNYFYNFINTPQIDNFPEPKEPVKYDYIYEGPNAERIVNLDFSYADFAPPKVPPRDEDWSLVFPPSLEVANRYKNNNSYQQYINSTGFKEHEKNIKYLLPNLFHPVEYNENFKLIDCQNMPLLDKCILLEPYNEWCYSNLTREEQLKKFADDIKNCANIRPLFSSPNWPQALLNRYKTVLRYNSFYDPEVINLTLN